MLNSGNRPFHLSIVWLVVIAIQPWCCCLGHSAAHAAEGAANTGHSHAGHQEHSSAPTHGMAPAGHGHHGCDTSTGKSDAASCGSADSVEGQVHEACGACECGDPTLVVPNQSSGSASASITPRKEQPLPVSFSLTATYRDHFRPRFLSGFIDPILPDWCRTRSLLAQGTLLTI